MSTRGYGPSPVSGKLSRLQLASLEGNLSEVKKILAAAGDSFDVDEGDSPGVATPAMLLAAGAGYSKVVRVLLAAGANPNNRAQTGLTALQICAANGFMRTARMLIDAGAKLDATTADEELQPLHLAARAGHERMCGLLKAAGAPTDATTAAGDTLLHLAAQEDRGHVLKWAVAEGLPLNPINAAGKTPLQVAYDRSHRSATSLLRRATTRKRRSVRHVVNHAGEAFLRAAREAEFETLRRYASDGKPIDYSAKNGWTALHEAAFAGQAKVVRWLLRQPPTAHSIKIHARNKAGWTALHIAADMGRLEIVQALVDAGADMRTPTKRGMTALDLAIDKGATEVVRWFTDYNPVAQLIYSSKGGSGGYESGYGKGGGSHWGAHHSTSDDGDAPGALAGTTRARGGDAGAGGGAGAGGSAAGGGPEDVAGAFSALSSGPNFAHQRQVSRGSMISRSTTATSMGSASTGLLSEGMEEKAAETRFEELRQWLKVLGLEQYASALQEDGFDSLDHVTSIVAEDLDDMKMKKGHRRTFLRAVAKLASTRALPTSEGPWSTRGVATPAAATPPPVPDRMAPGGAVSGAGVAPVGTPGGAAVGVASRGMGGRVGAAPLRVPSFASVGLPPRQPGLVLDTSYPLPTVPGSPTAGDGKPALLSSPAAGATGAGAAARAGVVPDDAGHAPSPPPAGGAGSPSGAAGAGAAGAGGAGAGARVTSPADDGTPKSTKGDKGDKGGKKALPVPLASLGAHLIAYKELKFQEKVGEGSFGVVRRALWRGMEVAVKELKLVEHQTEQGAPTAGLTATQLELRHEADMMKRVCNHDSIVQFVGVLLEPRPAVLTKFMRSGSLEELLVRDGPRNRRSSLSHEQLMTMAMHAAAGVVHLHRENVIHRDLACRNILVDEFFAVRVADFGFSRVKAANSSKGYTSSTMGPIKWMAPEALRYHQYSEASDVFSFGVCLYEITVGQPPWKGLDNMDVVVRVCNGQRMKLPSDIDPVCRDLMARCWHKKPMRRPTMEQIHDTLYEYVDKLRSGGGRSLHHRQRSVDSSATERSRDFTNSSGALPGGALFRGGSASAGSSGDGDSGSGESASRLPVGASAGHLPLPANLVTLPPPGTPPHAQGRRTPTSRRRSPVTNTPQALRRGWREEAGGLLDSRGDVPAPDHRPLAVKAGSEWLPEAIGHYESAGFTTRGLSALAPGAGTAAAAAAAAEECDEVGSGGGVAAAIVPATPPGDDGEALLLPKGLQVLHPGHKPKRSSPPALGDKPTGRGGAGGGSGRGVATAVGWPGTGAAEASTYVDGWEVPAYADTSAAAQDALGLGRGRTDRVDRVDRVGRATPEGLAVPSGLVAMAAPVRPGAGAGGSHPAASSAPTTRPLMRASSTPGTDYERARVGAADEPPPGLLRPAHSSPGLTEAAAQAAAADAAAAAGDSSGHVATSREGRARARSRESREATYESFF